MIRNLRFILVVALFGLGFSNPIHAETSFSARSAKVFMRKDMVLQGITTDSAGNMYVAGVIGNPTSPVGILIKFNSAGVEQWRRVASGNSGFNYVKTDAAGNVYVVGTVSYLWFQFGSHYSQYTNASATLLIKCNSAGIVQWVRSAERFNINGLAVDAGGSAYVAGWQDSGKTDYDASHSIEVFNTTAVLAKYSTSGEVQWVNSLNSSTQIGISQFNDLAIDPNGVAVVGVISKDIFDLGNQVSVTGNAISQGQLPETFLLVAKYNASGNAQWAKTAVGPAFSEARRLAVDPAGNAFVAGTMYSGSFDFGNGVTHSVGGEILLKYDASGNAQWVQGLASNPPGASMLSVMVDNSGNIFTTGIIDRPIQMGTTLMTSPNGNSIAAISKFNSLGVHQETQVPFSASPYFSGYVASTIDKAGNIIAIANLSALAPTSFGNGVTVQKNSADGIEPQAILTFR